MGIPQAVADRSNGISRVHIAVLIAAIAAGPALTGCAANFDAPTNLPYQPAAGISDRSGDVYALNTLVVANDDGVGTVVGRLVNQESDDDALESFAAHDSEGEAIAAAPLADPLALPAAPSAQQSVQVGTATSAELRLSGDNLVAGQFVTLSFTFDNAAPLSIEVPVVPSTDPLYADVPIGQPVSTPPSS